jgi:hypothetical protein
MIKSKTLIYYDFSDIEKFICQELGIEQKFFRDYHKVIGGSYKDFWHVWLSLHYDDIENGSYENLWFDMVYDRLSELKERYGDWIVVLEPVLKKLEQEAEEDYIIIHYWW